MGEHPSDGAATERTGPRWSATPVRAAKRSRLPELTWLLPPLLVIPPLIAMYRHGISPRRLEASALAAFVGAAAVAWVSRRRQPLATAGPVAVAVAVGIAVGSVTTVLFGLWIAAALVIGGLLAGNVAVTRGVARVAVGLGRLVAFALFLPLSVLVVLLPWVVNTLARVDPFRAPVSPGSAWVARRPGGVRPSQPWTKDHGSARLPLLPRVRSAVAWPVAFVGCMLLANLATGTNVLASIPGMPHRVHRYGQIVADDPGSADDFGSIAQPPVTQPPVGDGQQPEEPEEPSEDPPKDPGHSPGPGPSTVFEGDDWYPGYLEDMAWLQNPATAWQPLQRNRIGDVKTDTVNVDQGVRKSWRPPACGCRRLEVWFYGGSTAFGLGQRDEHTIASELARAAWEDGIAIDIYNRGVVGDVHWQEADRYAWDVATYGSPDAVIFYDGINDVTATQTLRNARVGDIYPAVDFQNDDFWRRYLELIPLPAVPDRPGASVIRPPTVNENEMESFVDLLMVRYNRARKMSRATSAVDDTPTYYSWQPDRLARPAVSGEPADDEGTPNGRQREAAIRPRVPRGVISLMDAFDGDRNPYFYDDQHHNEAGATVVATALYEKISGDLADLAAGRPVRTP